MGIADVLVAAILNTARKWGATSQAALKSTAHSDILECAKT
jgi:hypothetical protein